MADIDNIYTDGIDLLKKKHHMCMHVSSVVCRRANFNHSFLKTKQNKHRIYWHLNVNTCHRETHEMSVSALAVTMLATRWMSVLCQKYEQYEAITVFRRYYQWSPGGYITPLGAQSPLSDRKQLSTDVEINQDEFVLMHDNIHVELCSL